MWFLNCLLHLSCIFFETLLEEDPLGFDLWILDLVVGLDILLEPGPLAGLSTKLRILGWQLSLVILGEFLLIAGWHIWWWPNYSIHTCLFVLVTYIWVNVYTQYVCNYALLKSMFLPVTHFSFPIERYVIIPITSFVYLCSSCCRFFLFPLISLFFILICFHFLFSSLYFFIVLPFHTLYIHSSFTIFNPVLDDLVIGLFHYIYPNWFKTAAIKSCAQIDKEWDKVKDWMGEI